jgi:hypothetical protein
MVILIPISSDPMAITIKVSEIKSPFLGELIYADGLFISIPS